VSYRLIPFVQISKHRPGMFLYARLVLDYISANLFYNGDELKDAINQLPETLAELSVYPPLFAIRKEADQLLATISY
jgi:hypothetical protein